MNATVAQTRAGDRKKRDRESSDGEGRGGKSLEREAASSETTETGQEPHADAFERLGAGVNQAGGRAYNARLVLSLIRRNGALPKAGLARLTGLSPQTMTLIVRSLEAEGLLEAREPVRGRVGQPSVPYALAPDGAFSFGVKIGRRSSEVVLCDFLGEIRERARWTHPYPDPKGALDEVAAAIAGLRDKAPRPRGARRGARARFAGVGVAMPFELWQWADELGAPPGLLEGWADLDVAAVLSQRLEMPVYFANDATAACGAELARRPRAGGAADWLYVYVASFVGGGVVLGGALYQGRRQNAGALGSAPTLAAGAPSQLIHHASLITLERSARAQGREAGLLQRPEADWSALEDLLAPWIEHAARALAGAVLAGLSVIDFSRVVIDGAMPRATLERLVEATRRAAAAMPQQGLSPYEIVAGCVGADARALGAAMLPMNAAFASEGEAAALG